MLFEKDLFYRDSKRLDTFVCIDFPECEIEIGGVKGLSEQIRAIGFPDFHSERLIGIVHGIEALRNCGFISEEEYFAFVNRWLNYVFKSYIDMRWGNTNDWRDNRDTEKKSFPLKPKIGGDGKRRIYLYVSRDDHPNDLYNFSDSKMISRIMRGKLYQPTVYATFGWFLPYQEAIDLGFPELEKGMQVKIRIMKDGIKAMEDVGDAESEDGR